MGSKYIDAKLPIFSWQYKRYATGKNKMYDQTLTMVWSISNHCNNHYKGHFHLNNCNKSQCYYMILKGYNISSAQSKEEFKWETIGTQSLTHMGI